MRYGLGLGRRAQGKGGGGGAPALRMASLHTASESHDNCRTILLDVTLEAVGFKCTASPAGPYTNRARRGVEGARTRSAPRTCSFMSARDALSLLSWSPTTHITCAAAV